MTLQILKKLEQFHLQKQVSDDLAAYETRLREMEELADQVAVKSSYVLNEREEQKAFIDFLIQKHDPQMSLVKSYGGNRFKAFSQEERSVLKQALKALVTPQRSWKE